MVETTKDGKLRASQAATLVDALMEASEQAPDEVFAAFLTSPEAPPMTYGGAMRGARAVAAELIERGVQPGERVLAMLPTGSGFIRGFFGTQLSGAIPVPYPAPMLSRGDELSSFAQILDPLLKDGGIRFVLVDEARFDQLEGLESKSRATLVPVPSGVPQQVPEVDLVRPRPDTPAFIQYTSGPVLQPRGVILSHQAVVSNVHAIGEALDLRISDKGISWLPMFQDMGLVGALLTSLVWRYPTSYMLPEAFLLRPHTWLQNITDLEATIAAAPSFAFRLCVRRVRPKQMAKLDLRSLRVLLNGAESVDVDAVREFENKFQEVGLRGGVVVPAYGLAENSLAVTIGTPGVPLETESVESTDLPSLGRPVRGVSVELRGTDDERQHPGRIVITSTSAMDGYLGKPAQTAQVLVGNELHTGDLGVMRGGELYISGRSKDLIIKRGRNYYPEDIEQIVADVAPALGRTVAFAVGNAATGTEDLVVMGFASEGATEEAIDTHKRGIDTALLRILGIRIDRFVLSNEPLLSAERISRGACRESFLQRGTKSQ